jgi:O-antigen/teichoic acid export membrane protein
LVTSNKILKIFLLLKKRESRNRVLSLAQSIIWVCAYLVVMRYVVQAEGLEGVGIWSMTVGFVSFVRLMDLSGASGLARMLATKQNDPSEQAYYVDTMSLFIFSLYGVLCAFSYLPLAYFLNDSVSPNQWPQTQVLLIWALAALPLNVLGIAHLSAIDGIGRADIRSLVNILGVGLFSIISLALIEQAGLVGLACAQFAQFTATLLAARLVLVKQIKNFKFFPSKISLGAAKACIGYGLHLQLMSMPMALFDPLTRILVGRWAGLETLGVYDLSYKLAGHTRTLIQAYLSPLIPQFATQWIHSRGAARARFKSINEPTLRIVAAAFGTLVLFSPVASMFLLSEISAVFIFSTTAIALAWGLASLALPTHLLARAAGLLRWSIWGQFVILGLGPALVYWAVHQAGQVWVAIGVAVAIFIGHGIAYLGETRLLQISPIGFSDGRLEPITARSLVAFILLSILVLCLSAAIIVSSSTS